VSQLLVRVIQTLLKFFLLPESGPPFIVLCGDPYPIETLRHECHLSNCCFAARNSCSDTRALEAKSFISNAVTDALIEYDRNQLRGEMGVLE